MNSLKLVIFDLDDTLYDASGLLPPAPGELEKIKLFPCVPALCQAMRAQGVAIAIVSTGELARQRKKIRLLGLEELVDAVFICRQPAGKLRLFRRCVAKFGVPPRATLVVGDRIDREIAFGNALGCVTVRVMRGRHSHMAPATKGEMAAFTIFHLDALQLWFGPASTPAQRSRPSR